MNFWIMRHRGRPYRILTLAFSIAILYAICSAVHNRTYAVSLNTASDPVVNVEATNSSAWRDTIDTASVTITCTDKNGKAVPNAGVSIGVTSPGSVTPTSATTDSSGQVTVTVKSTDVDIHSTSVTVTASSQGVSGSGAVTLKGISVTFNPTSLRMGFYNDSSKSVVVSTVPTEAITKISIGSTGDNSVSIGAQKTTASSGTITFNVGSQTATPAGAQNKSGTQTLVATATNNTLAQAKAVVITPSAIGTPFPTYNGTVSPVNMSLDARTTPAYSGLPAGKRQLATVYIVLLTIQVVDQFGDPLDHLYTGADVYERDDQGNFNINKNLSSSGTYTDPVGTYVIPTNLTDTVVDAGSQAETDWLKSSYHEPLFAYGPKALPFSVEVAGISLSTNLKNRKTQTIPPDKLIITWQ